MANVSTLLALGERHATALQVDCILSNSLCYGMNLVSFTVFQTYEFCLCSQPCGASFEEGLLLFRGDS